MYFNFKFCVLQANSPLIFKLSETQTLTTLTVGPTVPGSVTSNPRTLDPTIDTSTSRGTTTTVSTSPAPNTTSPISLDPTSDSTTSAQTTSGPTTLETSTSFPNTSVPTTSGLTTVETSTSAPTTSPSSTSGPMTSDTTPQAPTSSYTSTSPVSTPSVPRTNAPTTLPPNPPPPPGEISSNFYLKSALLCINLSFSLKTCHNQPLPKLMQSVFYRH